MAKLFKNNNVSGNLSPRQLLENKYKGARGNLLLVIVFTVINIFLALADGDTYFLFSAFIPYALIFYGMFFCGMFPAEFYADGLEEMPFFNKSFFYVMLAVAIVFIALYLLSWIFSKKGKVGWIVFALVFFCIDTAAMFMINGFAVDSIMDILFHAWVIYYLAAGISADKKLKALDIEEAASEQEQAPLLNAEPIVETTEQ